MKTKKEILEKHINIFFEFKINKLPKFEDIPKAVFYNAMEDYAQRLIRTGKSETPKEYYERLRKQGWTDDITSNTEPNYNKPFYQNIFRLMDGYAKL